MDAIAAAQVYDGILELNQRAVATELPECAYPLLAAAAHAAEMLKDTERLQTLSTLAHKQGQWADEINSRILTEAANARGNTALFLSLLGTIHSMRLRLQSPGGNA